MPDFTAVYIDLDNFGLFVQTPSITQAKIEGCADHYDQIGQGKGMAAGTAHEEGEPGGKATSGRPVELDGDLCLFGALDKLRYGAKMPYL